MTKQSTCKFASIIIPAFNEEKHIGRCLDSITDLNFPKDFFEVIMIDNGSTDRTIEIANSFRDKLNLKIWVFPHINISALRNRGVEQAKGEILAFVDADCTVSKNWINNALKYFHDITIGAVGSHYDIPEEYSWVAKVWDLNNAKSRKIGYTKYLPGGNIIIPKKFFLEVNGFDESLATNEDYELCSRIRKKGLKIYSDPDISVLHWGVPQNLFNFYRRHKWHGTHVFKVFLNNIWELKNIKAISYALYYIFFVFTFLIGLSTYLFSHNISFLVLSLVALLILPSFLSFRTVMKQQVSLKYLLPLTVLYFVYGIARARSVSSLGNFHWK